MTRFFGDVPEYLHRLCTHFFLPWQWELARRLADPRLLERTRPRPRGEIYRSEALGSLNLLISLSLSLSLSSLSLRSF